MSTVEGQQPSVGAAAATSNVSFESPFSLNFSASSGQAVAPSPSGFATLAASNSALSSAPAPITEETPLPLDEVPGAVKLLRRALRQPERKVLNDPAAKLTLVRLVHCQPVITLNAMEDAARLNCQDARNRLLLAIARQPLISFSTCSDFIKMLANEYKAMYDMSTKHAPISPVSSVLESNHLTAMGLSWRLVYEHYFECVVFTHERFRSLQPILLDKLRPPPNSPDSDLEPLKGYLILDGEMRRIRCQWDEAQPAVTRWREANKPPEGIPWPPDNCAMDAEDFSLGSAPGPFVTCERCTQTICTCPNCIMSHYISCGVLVPRCGPDGTTSGVVGLQYNDDEDEFEENFMALARSNDEANAAAAAAEAEATAEAPPSSASTGEGCGRPWCERCNQQQSATQSAQATTQTAAGTSTSAAAAAAAVAAAAAAAAPVSAGYHANRDRLRQKLKEKRKQQQKLSASPQPKQQQQQQQQQQAKSSSDIDELVRFIEGPNANSSPNNAAAQAKGKRSGPAPAAASSASATPNSAKKSASNLKTKSSSSVANATTSSISSSSNSASQSAAQMSNSSSRKKIDSVFLPRSTAASSSTSAAVTQPKQNLSNGKKPNGIEAAASKSDDSEDLLNESVASGGSDNEFDQYDSDPDPVVEQFKSFVLQSPTPAAQRQRVSCLDMQSLVQRLAVAKNGAPAAATAAAASNK